MSESIDEIKNNILTLEDVYRINGTSEKEVKPFRNPINKDQISTNADSVIKQITKAYNQNKLLDLNNVYQSQWYLHWRKDLSSHNWIYRVVYSGYYHVCLGYGHYFVRMGLALDAVEKFKPIWIDYLPE